MLASTFASAEQNLDMLIGFPVIMIFLFSFGFLIPIIFSLI